MTYRASARSISIIRRASTKTSILQYNVKVRAYSGR